MRFLGYLILGCIFLAALKAAIIVMVVAVALIVLIGIATRPFETFAWLLGFALLGMAQAYPMAGLIVLGLLILAAVTDRPNSERW